MRIFYSQVGDPMLLSTVDGLREFYERYIKFLRAPETVMEFESETNGSPSPYDRFLNGIRVIKSESKASLEINESNWLELKGSTEELIQFGKKILVQEDGAHKHWYSLPNSLIIEADSSWQN